MRAGFWMAMVVAATLASGCLAPYRPHVDPDALARLQPAWTEERFPVEEGGWLDARTVETKYRHNGSGDGPPYPGVLQVFGIREPDARSSDQLLEETRRIVAAAAQREKVRIDEGKGDDGERTLSSGLRTKWFVQEGSVVASGAVFDEDVVVRIVGEVGFDGRSSTGFIAVGIAQVEEHVRIPVCTGPVLPTCEQQLQPRRDLATWTSLVGDPEGTIGQARAQHALLWNLVTHG